MALKPDLTVPVLGLNVDANPLVRERGSLAVAENIVLRQPGKAGPAMAPVLVTAGDSPRLVNFAPDASTYGVRVFCQGDTNVLAIERASAGGTDTDATKLRQSNDPTNEVSTVALGSSTRSLSFDNQRCQHSYSDGRHFVTSESGVLVLDGLETSSNQALRLAGLVSPAEFSSTTSSGASYGPLILPANKYVAYKVLQRRKVGDKYVLYGPTSRAITVYANGTAVNVQLTVKFSTSQDKTLAGDEFVVYKTKAADSTDLIIETYYETMVHTLTSAERTAGEFSAYDQTTDDGLAGAELYTNDGQDGAFNPNYPPPLASDACAFAGSMLYTNYRAWPTLSFKVGGKYAGRVAGFGSATFASSDDSLRGVGLRRATGAHVGGTNTITGISATDIIGWAVGQYVMHAGAGASTPPYVAGYITSIVAAGPTYTVTVSATWAAAPAGPPATVFWSVDTAVLTFYDAAGATITSQRVPIAFYYGSTAMVDYYLRNLSLSGCRFFTSLVASDLDDTLVSSPTLTFVCADSAACARIEATDITNGANYSNTELNGSSYELSSIQDTRENLVWFSKLQQPEAVSPLANFVVGAERVLRLTKVGAAVLAWCTDGLYMVQGDAVSGFTTQLLDPKCVLYHPSAVAVLGNTTYALTYSGVVRAGEGGLESVSKNAVDSLIQDQFGNWPDTWLFAAVADPVNNEVRFSLPSGDTLVFNAATNQWAMRTDDMIHGCFDRGKDAAGRRTPDVVTTTATGYYCDSDHAAAAVLEHNPIAPEAPTIVHQYVDTCLMFEEDLVPTVGITFDGAVSRSVTPSATETAHELQCRVPRRAARKPRLRVGFQTALGNAGTTPTWSYSGFGCRYRASSLKVKR
jgi:hypothetical protein